MRRLAWNTVPHHDWSKRTRFGKVKTPRHTYVSASAQGRVFLTPLSRNELLNKLPHNTGVFEVHRHLKVEKTFPYHYLCPASSACPLRLASARVFMIPAALGVPSRIDGNFNALTLLMVFVLCTVTIHIHIHYRSCTTICKHMSPLIKCPCSAHVCSLKAHCNLFTVVID